MAGCGAGGVGREGQGEGEEPAARGFAAHRKVVLWSRPALGRIIANESSSLQGRCLHPLPSLSFKSTPT